MNVLLIASLAVVPAVLAGTDATDKKVMENIDLFNLYSNCWGADAMKGYLGFYLASVEQCDTGSATAPTVARVQQAVPAVAPLNIANPWFYGTPSVVHYGRKKRQAAVIDQNEVAKLVGNLQEFNELNKEKMDTLMCVLTKFDFLDSFGNIDINKVLNQYGQTGDIQPTNANADPAFVNKLTAGVRDCYAVSQSWPQVMLDRHEWTKKYGRQYIFLQCLKKIEERMCYMYQAKTMLEALYGNMDNIDHQAYGFPEDKYEAAYLSVKAATETSSPAAKFVDSILFSRANFL